jgi:hypothetical protein
VNLINEQDICEFLQSLQERVDLVNQNIFRPIREQNLKPGRDLRISEVFDIHLYANKTKEHGALLEIHYIINPNLNDDQYGEACFDALTKMGSINPLIPVGIYAPGMRTPKDVVIDLKRIFGKFGVVINVGLIVNLRKGAKNETD